MAFAGHVAVALALDKRGEVAAGPTAILTGIPHHAPRRSDG